MLTPKMLRLDLLAVVASLLVLATAAFAADPVPASKPLSPTEALAAFQLAEKDLKIELAAAEPEVVDPVAIRFDERGRMWVAEMGDYPLGPPPGEPPLSRIKVLEDLDADGKFEKATLFADKLSFVTGLQPWRGGVIVTLAGRIAWMKDTDGDSKMDVDETWYTGFAEQNSQLRANHPRLALDNHVYVANGLRGGVVVNKRLPNEPPINLQGRDFRFDPLTGKAESISGNGQFGMCFDDWGNRFTCTNRNPVIHVVLEDRYLKLAPKIPIAAVVQDVAAAAEKSKVFPISRAWTTSNLHAGTFTAACGVHVYRGDTLRDAHRRGGFRPWEDLLGDNSVFTCDPTGNFVHREKMQSGSPTFYSSRAYDNKEFLASTDEWFRPVSIETGPDGYLYIVDMYRCVIEHPDFVPDELKKRPDLRLGDDRGRIWRITLSDQPKEDSSPAAEILRDREMQARKREREKKSMIAAETSGLVALLSHENAWHRETAQRLLLERADPKTLECVAASSGGTREAVHALWLLHGLGQLDAKSFATYFESTNREVQRQALLVAEELLEQKKIEPHVVQLDSAFRENVKFQSLLFNLSQKGDALEDEIDPKTIPRDWDSNWLKSAALLRYHQQLLPVFRKSAESNFEHSSFQTDVARLIGSNSDDRDAMRVIKISGRFPAEKIITIVEALAAGLQKRNRKLEDVLRELQRLQGNDQAKLYANVSLEIAGDATKRSIDRLAAVRLLGYLPGTQARLRAQLQDAAKFPAELQTALVAALAQRGNESDREWQELLGSYEANSLPIKRSLIDNSFRRTGGPKLLLEQVKTGVIQAAEIDPLRRKQLLESKDAAINKLAEELFAALNPANRQQALEDYQAALKLKGDSKQGAMIFEKNCSTCHRVGEIGVNVAPDISDTRTKTAAQLLGDIIQPNRAIDSNFIGYQLLLKDGTAVSGLLAAETSTSLTVKQPGGKVLTIARDEVEQLKATGVSLMPDGLEKNIAPQAMADLLSYLKNWRYLDGKTPLSPGTP
ncbi:PVC-type heme-binding CxxCH protein [Anatilimnocola floriformis]|uniref:PVC-type heme-binding CxxCH protein n=1 Tax=Anatilimnocola floriformis TaxID=2948575 RepID=UPI0020C3E1F2|nr:PVC-type heme-binding CxxCH protein [Anatilimnocola floriformis]